jgi:RNA polymerase sigma factor (sigma-70 family)
MGDFLTAKEERRLIRLGQRGDLDARNRVIMNVYYLINQQVGRRSKRLGNEFNDALHQVIVTLCEKFHKFELKRNLRYSTYARWWIRKSVSRYIDHMGLIQIPDYMCRPQNKDTTSFEKYKKQALDAKKVIAIEPGEHGNKMVTQEGFLSRELQPDSIPEYLDDLNAANKLLDTLRPRERKIIELRSQGNVLKQIGEKLGITRERVRQIESEAKQKLRKRLKEKA